MESDVARSAAPAARRPRSPPMPRSEGQSPAAGRARPPAVGAGGRDRRPPPDRPARPRLAAVPGDHQVIQPEAQLRQRLVLGRQARQALEAAPKVVGEIAGQAAGPARDGATARQPRPTRRGDRGNAVEPAVAASMRVDTRRPSSRLAPRTGRGHRQAAPGRRSDRPPGSSSAPDGRVGRSRAARVRAGRAGAPRRRAAPAASSAGRRSSTSRRQRWVRTSRAIAA